MNELTLSASVENVEAVTDFVNELLEQNKCSMKAQMQIDVAVDEIFSNIAHYAYGEGQGNATVKIQFDKDSAKLTFIDSGVEYNPLLMSDPDTTLSAEERQIGGLGIFLVKKTMDDVLYSYVDGKNILTIIKKIK